MVVERSSPTGEGETMTHTTAELEDPPTVKSGPPLAVQSNGTKAAVSNGHPRNGHLKFSQETVAAVRERTEQFFIETLNKSPEEAKHMTDLITGDWPHDLELTE